MPTAEALPKFYEILEKIIAEDDKLHLEFVLSPGLKADGEEKIVVSVENGKSFPIRSRLEQHFGSLRTDFPLNLPDVGPSPDVDVVIGLFTGLAHKRGGGRRQRVSREVFPAMGVEEYQNLFKWGSGRGRLGED